ncbi:MAG TPA: HyaD/HybD family hydrogenase maturation endopeptidase [Nitrospirota bacterium]|nr:HyaD/HybD family hydrogenase maturation endopeptidase [Nitrospirota bacterium]
MRKKRETTVSSTIRPERSSGRIVILGLGNILLSDEGIGVRAVEAMQERYTFDPPVEVVDGGTMGLDLLPYFELDGKVLIIDAVDFGKPPGHVGVLENDQIPSVLRSKLSSHHIGLNDLLAAAKLVDSSPSQVSLIGIQPRSLDVSLDMTEEIRVKLDELIALAVRKLAEWNVACVSRSPQKS